jgi:SepF-like predicted cell division protein (DUF552 family)
MGNIIEIKRLQLEDTKDITTIETDLKAGKILFIDTARFFTKYQQDITICRQIIEKMQTMTRRVGGSLGRIGENTLILSPYSHIGF